MGMKIIPPALDYTEVTEMLNARGGDARISNNPGARRYLKRPAVNITSVERLGRVAIGLFAIIAALVLLTTAGSVLAVVLEILLVLAGVDLAVTGALGHCPLYHKLGYVPASLRSSS